MILFFMGNKTDAHVWPLQELSHFVAGQWVALQDVAPGGTYYYNLVTARTQWDEPIRPQKASLGTLALPHRVLIHG